MSSKTERMSLRIIDFSCTACATSIEKELKKRGGGELPTAEACGLPASTTRLGPHPPRAQAYFGEAVSMTHVRKVGYGGLDLHRRNFGLPHPYQK